MQPTEISLASPLRVLIVEDEMLIAMDLEAMVEDCGYAVAGIGASLAEVSALDGAMAPPDLALVDYQLAGNSTGVEVCSFIRQHWERTLVLYVTANPTALPRDLAGGYGVITKPYSETAMKACLHYAGAAIRGDAAAVSKPEGLTLRDNLASAAR